MTGTGTTTRTSTRWWLRQDFEELTVAAPAEVVYDLVADLPRMGDWSPECRSVEWTDGSTEAVAEATFVGHNRTGPGGKVKWSRKGRVLEAERGRAFAFFTEEGGSESTIWRYELEAQADGTTLVRESYDVRWIPVVFRIIDVPTNRAKDLRRQMCHTLGQLKAAAEASVG